MLLGNILNIYDSLNFDVGFESDIALDTVNHEPYEYKTAVSVPDIIENDTNLPIVAGKSYRCHLKDLRFRANAKCHHDYAISKKILIQWSDYSDGHVLCKIHNIDTYNRLIVEIFDPFTMESYKTYLINNFQTIFCIYQYNTPTVKLNEMHAERMIPRPKSFQLPDNSYSFR